MSKKEVDIKKINVVILAGGFGTRLPEYTKLIPKPMIEIRRKPILMHIIEHYQNYGFRRFIIATGYKQSSIVSYFKKKFRIINNKNKRSKKINYFYQNSNFTNFTLVNTGLKTMTGGRLKKLKKILNQSDYNFFCMTYGDGISNVNLKKLLKFHLTNKGIGTVTAVRPPSRFGALKLKKNIVFQFKEKTNFFDSWINGGFFIFQKEIFNYIKNDLTYLEKEPLSNLSKEKKLFAYKHKGFWHCMDTLRDKKNLENFLKNAK